MPIHVPARRGLPRIESCEAGAALGWRRLRSTVPTTPTMVSVKIGHAAQVISRMVSRMLEETLDAGMRWEVDHRDDHAADDDHDNPDRCEGDDQAAVVIAVHDPTSIWPSM